MDGNGDDAEAVYGRVQGQGGAGGDPGGSDAGGAGGQARHSPDDDRGMEAATRSTAWPRPSRARPKRPGSRATPRSRSCTPKSGSRWWNGILSKGVRAMSVARRRQMIERERARLSIAAQSRLVSISRGRAIRIPSIAFVPTCCTIWRSRGRVTSGVPTSPPPSRGQALHPDAARLPVPGRDHGLGEPQGARLAAVEHDGRGSSASRHRRRHWRVSAGPRSSIPIRAASSRAPALLTCCATPRCGSAWMGAAGGWTTSSSSGSGGR